MLSAVIGALLLRRNVPGKPTPVEGAVNWAHRDGQFQGGEVSIDWKKAGAAGSIIGGIAVMHGPRTRKWRYIHTFGVVLGTVSAIPRF